MPRIHLGKRPRKCASHVNESQSDSNGKRTKVRFASLWQSRFFRLACLVGLLIFELGFIWFIRHYGWLESINLWTQLGVLLIAASPLIVAAFFLIRKRFSLTSALVAFTMFAVFMGFTMRPVYEARQARASGQLLIESGAMIHYGYTTLNLNEDVPRFEYHQIEKTPVSDWMTRMLGDFASCPTENEIRSLRIETNAQMEVFSKLVTRLKKMEMLHLGAEAGATCERYETFIRQSGIRFLVVASNTNANRLNTDLNWLGRCESVRVLIFANVVDAVDMTIESDDLKLDVMDFRMSPQVSKFPVAAFVDCEAVSHLKVLSISSYQFSEAEIQPFSRLTNLKSLKLDLGVNCGIDFLQRMPNLTSANVSMLSATESELRAFKIPANLKEFQIFVSSALISESVADEFKNGAPEGCRVNISRQ